MHGKNWLGTLLVTYDHMGHDTCGALIKNVWRGTFVVLASTDTTNVEKHAFSAFVNAKVLSHICALQQAAQTLAAMPLQRYNAQDKEIGNQQLI